MSWVATSSSVLMAKRITFISKQQHFCSAARPYYYSQGEGKTVVWSSSVSLVDPFGDSLAKPRSSHGPCVVPPWRHCSTQRSSTHSFQRFESAKVHDKNQRIRLCTTLPVPPQASWYRADAKGTFVWWHLCEAAAAPDVVVVGSPSVVDVVVVVVDSLSVVDVVVVV
eukprot:6463712-Amphidinium_carterae.4